eukprot:9377084-Karenia_brevis.AAC.1
MLVVSVSTQLDVLSGPPTHHHCYHHYYHHHLHQTFTQHYHTNDNFTPHHTDHPNSTLCQDIGSRAILPLPCTLLRSSRTWSPSTNITFATPHHIFWTSRRGGQSVRHWRQQLSPNVHHVPQSCIG